ncbi:hypothetical protein [Kribbella sp. NPDC004536]
MTVSTVGCGYVGSDWAVGVASMVWIVAIPNASTMIAPTATAARIP